MGAWIETCIRRIMVTNFMSHPMWVRGLKQLVILLVFHLQRVASYVGAWIETVRVLHFPDVQKVASYVGAWIETFHTSLMYKVY